MSVCWNEGMLPVGIYLAVRRGKVRNKHIWKAIKKG